MGDQSRAVTDYTKAIDLDPSYAEAYENRSRSYYRSGDKEKGAADSAKAVSLRIARPVA
jgi:tetratricopeptide (TPR) repeat protein